MLIDGRLPMQYWLPIVSLTFVSYLRYTLYSVQCTLLDVELHCYLNNSSIIMEEREKNQLRCIRFVLLGGWTLYQSRLRLLMYWLYRETMFSDIHSVYYSSFLYIDYTAWISRELFFAYPIRSEFECILHYIMNSYIMHRHFYT